MLDTPFLPIDPRLVNVDDALHEIITEHFKPNVNLVGIHLETPGISWMRSKRITRTPASIEF
jgi:hypothetical protein